MNKVVIFGGMLIASLALAEEQSSTVAQGSTAATAPVAATSGIIGSVEIRPSLQSESGEIRTENNLQAGYQINPDLTVKGVVDVNTHIKNNSNLSGSTASNAEIQGIHLRTDVKNIAQVGSFALSYQNRLYAPTLIAAKRDHGHLTSMRNYFNFKTQLSESVSLTLAEVPVFHVYNVAGTADQGGSPVLENRIYVMPSIALGKISIDPALWWAVKKHRSYGSGKNDGTLSNHLEFDLDITYAINDKVSAGVGYYSNNLLSAMPNGETKGFAIGEGFRTGVPQIIFSASL